jgi:hypothetical protein
MPCRFTSGARAQALHLVVLNRRAARCGRMLKGAAPTPPTRRPPGTRTPSRWPRLPATIVSSLPATRVGAKMLTSATAPQMPSTAMGRPHRAVRSRVGKAAPNRTKPVATAAHGQIVSATIGTWSCASLIRSGANMLLSAVASQRPPTATAVGSIRPVRWSRWTSWVLCGSTSVAVMRSSPLFDALASVT